MGNTIFSRVSQLVRANINELIDQAEDPEVMLDQLVRDYTEGIGEARGEVATVIGNLRLTEADQREAADAAVEWGEKAKIASRKADDAETSDEASRLNGLAEVALRKQLSFEQEAERLQAKVTADTSVVDSLKDGLQKMELKLETLKTKRSELVSRAKMAQAQSKVQSAVQSVNATDPTSELNRFEERIRNQEAQVRGFEELQSDSIDEQFADLDRDAADAEVQQRLAALKAKQPA
jgi:phage shock protein A